MPMIYIVFQELPSQNGKLKMANAKASVREQLDLSILRLNASRGNTAVMD